MLEEWYETWKNWGPQVLNFLLVSNAEPSKLMK